MSPSTHRNIWLCPIVVATSLAAMTTTVSAQVQATSNAAPDLGNSRGRADVFRLVQDSREDITVEGLKTLLGYQVTGTSQPPVPTNKNEVTVFYTIETPYDRSSVSPSLSYTETIDQTSHVRTGFYITGSFTSQPSDSAPCLRVRDLDDAARFSGWNYLGTSDTFISHDAKYTKGHLHLAVHARGGTGEGPSATASPPAPDDYSCVQFFFVGAKLTP